MDGLKLDQTISTAAQLPPLLGLHEVLYMTYYFYHPSYFFVISKYDLIITIKFYPKYAYA